MRPVHNKKLDRRSLAKARTLLDEAITCRGQGKYRAAALCRRSLQILERAGGSHHTDVANTLNTLAAIHEQRGEYAEAERLYQRSIDCLQSVTGNADLETVRAQAWGGLANLFRVQGYYAKAESLFQQALPIAEKALGPADLEVSALLNNLAVLYKYMGRFAEAERLYRRTLAITVKVLGRDDPEVATIYHNLGGLEHARGRYAVGEPLARRSVKIRAKALGNNHPDVAADKAALAGLLDGQGKFKESERLYQDALAVFEREFGPNHYEVAVNCNNLAALYHAQGNGTSPERLYQRALRIKQKVLGPDHPDVALTLNNLAVFYKSLGRFAEARTSYERALAIFEKALGPAHPNVAACLSNCASLLKAEAETLEARAQWIETDWEEVQSSDPAERPALDQRLACFRLVVRPSRIHRWGVYADEVIPPRRKVIEYTGERVSRREAKRRSESPRQYLFHVNGYWALDGAVGGSGAEWINHSCEPNLYSCLVKGEHVLYFSKRRIEPGEELTVDYRFDADSPRVPCHCGSLQCRGTINAKKSEIRNTT